MCNVVTHLYGVTKKQPQFCFELHYNDVYPFIQRLVVSKIHEFLMIPLKEGRNWVRCIRDSNCNSITWLLISTESQRLRPQLGLSSTFYGSVAPYSTIRCFEVSKISDDTSTYKIFPKFLRFWRVNWIVSFLCTYLG